MDALSALLGRNGFLPHGYCFTWSPTLLWGMVGADALIALSYFSIPVALVTFIRRRADLQFKAMAWLFSAFIFACGLTHVLDVWTIWNPDYGVLALTKVVTAGISVATAVALWPLMPRALKIPSVAQLRGVIQSLEAEVARRHSAEEHLAEVQQSLALTLTSIGAGFMATDREGRVTRMNSVAERLLGWTHGQALGKPLMDVFQREGRTAAEQARNPVEMAIEQELTVETARHVTAISRQGVRTAVEMKVAVNRVDSSNLIDKVDGCISSNVRGITLVFRDLTSQMRAEAESSRLAAIVESSNDAIVGKTLDGRITNWNRGAEMLFGYSADEAIGQRIHMLIPADRQGEEAHAIAQVESGRRVPAFETLRVAKDGSAREVSVSISPICDARGQIVGASKIARDVSRQKRAEEALRDSESRLRFTLDSAQVGDWDLDLHTGAISRSLRHDQTFGYAQLQPHWNVEMFLAHVHADERNAVQARLDNLRQSRGDWVLECRVVWPDGSVHWIRMHGNLRRDNGKPRRMLGIVIDCTEAKQAEQARLTAQRLEAENRQIQEASRLKSQFLANMSHELRTPLNAIIGFADLMHAGAMPPTSPKHKEFSGYIGSSGRHLLALIDNVLELSNAQSDKLDFFPEPVALTPLVHEVRDGLAAAMQAKQLRFEAHIDPALAHLVLDPARLKQVLYNYLSNAIKFTGPGGQITLRAMPQGSKQLRIEVQDTGIGIAPADVPRLFSAFQQLDNGYDKRHQGIGLGLALTRRLIQAQGGDVGVDSALGVGSVFYAVLDRQPGQRRHQQPQELQPQELQPQELQPQELQPQEHQPQEQAPEQLQEQPHEQPLQDPLRQEQPPQPPQQPEPPQQPQQAADGSVRQHSKVTA